MQEFSFENKIIRLYEGGSSCVVYLNMYMDDTGKIASCLKKTGVAANLVTIHGLDWDSDMSPWAIPAISKGDTPCNGGADAYLSSLTKIIDTSERTLGAATKRVLCGYSLAGLFAIYALYKTDLFDIVGSFSGSLWFPDFVEFATSNPMQKTPQKAYFSLGDKEAKTSNKYLCKVQDATTAIYEHFLSLGIPSTFVLNPGNHFVNATERTVAGIKWLVA